MKGKEFLFKLLEDNHIKISDAQEMLRKILSKKKVKEEEQKLIDKFINLLQENSIQEKELKETLLPFADPTFDTTFKMLFGSKEHDNILISLLNNLLDLSDDKKITKLEIITEKLETPVFSYSEGESSVSGAVDVLCTTANGQKIAVEMQRAKQPYFLARTQHYMSKLISVQVNEKGSKDYHKDILDTYILVLEKQNLFTGQHKLSDESLYEIEVEPLIKQTKEVFPGNKMHWKFFELTKFQQHDVYKSLTKDSNLKHQWLEFLINCGEQLNEPERNDIIKEGYKIMKLAQWNGDKQALYWLEQAREFDQIENQKEEKLKAFEEGLKKGKLEERLTGDIDNIKTGIKLNIEPKDLTTTFTFKCLNKKRFLEKSWSEEQLSKKVKYDHPEAGKDARKEVLKFLDIFNYVKDHQSEKSDAICSDLKLLGDLEVIGYSSDAEEYN